MGTYCITIIAWSRKYQLYIKAFIGRIFVQLFSAPLESYTICTIFYEELPITREQLLPLMPYSIIQYVFTTSKVKLFTMILVSTNCTVYDNRI